MFDFLRVAGLAALTLGAAGASGAIPATTSVATAIPAVDTTALPPAPAVLPLESDAPSQAKTEATPSAIDQPRAESLAALVRRHAASETADREQHCLASAIYFEAKGEPLDGQLAVAHVILNRAGSGRFASTLCGVVMQRGQFSFVRRGSMPAISSENRHWRTAVAVAKIAQADMWNSSTENALYFHARRVAPGWRMARVGAIGNHVFYR